MLVNVKLNNNGCKRITFQGFKLHWPSQFVMVPLKRSWHIGILVLWRVVKNSNGNHFSIPVREKMSEIFG